MKKGKCDGLVAMSGAYEDAILEYQDMRDIVKVKKLKKKV